MWLNEQFGYWKMTNEAQQRLTRFFRENLRLLFERNDVQVFEIMPGGRGGMPDGDGGAHSNGA